MRKWLVTFALSCTVSIAGVLTALWALGGFGELGLGLRGTVALVLGIAFTVAVGVGLMALVFASDRGDHDQQVHRAHVEH